MTKFFSLLAIAVAVAAPQTLRADIVTFGAQSPIAAPGTTNDQSFVDTTGVGVLALNFTDVDEASTPPIQDVTVNGVFFNEIGAVDSQATQTFVGSGVTVNISGGGNFRDDSNSLGTVDGSLGFGGTDVFALLNSGYIEVDQIDFSGLTPGDDYLLQFFVHDTRNNNQNDVTSFQGTTAGSNLGTVAVDNTGTVMDGITRTGDEIGGFITGTFTADAAGNGDLVILVTSALGDESVNGLQLRNITVTVPEPSSVFVLLGGMGTLLVRRRK